MQHDLRLTTHGVCLEPLSHAHAPALAALVDAELWAGMTTELPDTIPAMETYVDAALAAGDHLAFAVLGPDGEVRGSTRFYELSTGQHRVEIGSTFYGRDWWAGVTNPACKLMLLGHAFEELGLRRVRCAATPGTPGHGPRSCGSAPRRRAGCVRTAWRRTAPRATPCTSRSCPTSGPWSAPAWRRA